MEPVANIALKDSYKSFVTELSIYIKENVFTETALKCTEAVIEQNGGHYSAWSFRRRVLFALKKPLEEELEFICNFTIETPKNYQLWQHRQVILDRIGTFEVAEKDLESTKIHLSADSKNIHCWQYRQWLIRHFNLPTDPELEYTEVLFKDDIFNNSAWNHRFYLIKFSKEYKQNKDNCLLKEFLKILEFSSEFNENNECFWNYLASLIQDSSSALSMISAVFPVLFERIGTPEGTKNYLYLRFFSRFSEIDRQFVCEKLKELHPINRAFWSTVSQK